MTLVVAIDGPAGSGKSTVARSLARHLGWIYVSTGSLYRALALLLFEAGTHLNDAGAIERFSSFLSERFRQDHHSGRVFLGEKEVTAEIRSPAVSEGASLVAQQELVRSRLLPVQRRLVLECNGAVVDGRDMGTVVFPDAPLKIFLTASAQERARRRMQEFAIKGQEVSLENLVKEIDERDARDAGREFAPMKPADDAVILDSSLLSSDQVLAEILRLVAQRGLVPL